MLTLEARPAPIAIEAERAAVPVVDMQNDFGAPGGMFDRAGIDITMIRRVIEPISRVLVAARRAHVPVIYLKMEHQPDLSDAGAADCPHRIKHGPFLKVKTTAPDGTTGRNLIKDTWNTKIIGELAPSEGDVVVSKHRYSGFYQTNLDDTLKSRVIKYLIVTGCTTSVCVESTVRDAMFRDYSCVVLEDCTAEPIGSDLPRTNHDASLLVIERLFGWVSSSGNFIAALGTRCPADEVRRG